MTSSSYRLPLALPRLRRAEGDGALAGVCAGIAKSLRVDPTLVRLAFAMLAFAGGAGFAAYGGAWLALAPENGPTPSPRRRLVGFAALAIAGAIALRGFGFSDALIWPAGTSIDTLPPGTSLVSIVQTGGPPAGGPLPPGASGTAVLVLRVNPNVPAGTVLTNSVRGTSSTPDPNPGNDTGTATS